MERLTKWLNNGNGSIGLEPIMDILTEKEKGRLTDALNKLADYEDAEENGTLIKLPCKVGDTVWVVTVHSVAEFKVDKIEVASDKIILLQAVPRGTVGINVDRVGKDVFFTREAAEAALKERSNEQNT